MWLTPYRSSTSSDRSATSCVTRPSAAPPKMIRVLSCPVRPKGIVGILMRPAYQPVDCAVTVGVLPCGQTPSFRRGEGMAERAKVTELFEGPRTTRRPALQAREHAV